MSQPVNAVSAESVVNEQENEEENMSQEAAKEKVVTPKSISDMIESEGRKDLYMLDPHKIIILEDESELNDDRAKTFTREMVENIKELGIIIPIRTVLGDSLPDGRKEVYVLDGRNRVRAARMANEEFAAEGRPDRVLIPCSMVKASAVTRHAMMISANRHRRDSTPLECARQVERHIALGGTQTSASLAFGVSLSSVGNWMKLIKCSAATQKAVEDKLIPVDAAKLLHKLSRDEQAAAVAEMTKDGAVPIKGEKARQAAVRAANHATSLDSSSSSSSSSSSGGDGGGEASSSKPTKRSKLEIQIAYEQSLSISADKINDYGCGFRDALAWVLGLISESQLRSGIVGVAGAGTPPRESGSVGDNNDE